MAEYPPGATAFAFLRCSLRGDRDGTGRLLRDEKPDELIAGLLALAEMFGVAAHGSKASLLAQLEEYLRVAELDP